MENLLDRIKPEFLDKIVDNKFPAIASDLIKVLKNETFVLELKLYDANTLYGYVYGIYESFTLFKYLKIFNEIKYERKIS